MDLRDVSVLWILERLQKVPNFILDIQIAENHSNG
jgi:hypothetical protein